MTTTCPCGKPTAGAILCERCQETLRWALVNVSAHYTDLGTVVAKQVRYGSGAASKGSIGKVQPLVVDMRFTDKTASGSQLTFDARNTVSTWARVVMDEQPELHGPACGDCLHTSCSALRRRRWPIDTVPSMITYLARQFRFVVAAAWAPDILDELLDLERRLTRMVNRPPDRWYAGKCTAGCENGNTCSAVLYATEDRGTLTCPGCGTRHDVAGRREFLLEEAKGYLVTATEAAVALMAWTDYDGSESKLVDRIRKWRDRDRLEVCEVTSLSGRDRHLYRLGDIQELLIGHAQREQQRKLGA